MYNKVLIFLYHCIIVSLYHCMSYRTQHVIFQNSNSNGDLYLCRAENREKGSTTKLQQKGSTTNLHEIETERAIAKRLYNYKRALQQIYNKTKQKGQSFARRCLARCREAAAPRAKRATRLLPNHRGGRQYHFLN